MAASHQRQTTEQEMAPRMHFNKASSTTDHSTVTTPQISQVSAPSISANGASVLSSDCIL